MTHINAYQEFAANGDRVFDKLHGQYLTLTAKTVKGTDASGKTTGMVTNLVNFLNLPSRNKIDLIRKYNGFDFMALLNALPWYAEKDFIRVLGDKVYAFVKMPRDDEELSEAEEQRVDALRRAKAAGLTIILYQ